MLIYNLTATPLEFRGKVLPANGGSLDYPELNAFISNRDRELAQAGVISVGKLPEAWKARRMHRTVLAQATGPATSPLALRELPTKVVEEAMPEPMQEPEEKKLEKTEKHRRR